MIFSILGEYLRTKNITCISSIESSTFLKTSSKHFITIFDVSPKFLFLVIVIPGVSKIWKKSFEYSLTIRVTDSKADDSSASYLFNNVLHKVLLPALDGPIISIFKNLLVGTTLKLSKACLNSNVL